MFNKLGTVQAENQSNCKLLGKQALVFFKVKIKIPIAWNWFVTCTEILLTNY